MRGVVAACLLGGSLGVAACLLELGHEIACGDGYTDTRAGEECDPADIDSYSLACGGRGGSCNHESCQLECCGDRVVNADEECDGPDLGLLGPGSGAGDDDTCRRLTVPGTTVPYARGHVRCTADCRFDRSDCSLCGNGQIDRQVVYPDGTVLGAEICDGELVRFEELWSQCASACGGSVDDRIECRVDCNGCRLLTLGEPLDCCHSQGTPLDQTVFDCCCSLHERGCELVVAPEPGAPELCPGVNPES